MNIGRMEVDLLVRGCTLFLLMFYIIKQRLPEAFIFRREGIKVIAVSLHVISNGQSSIVWCLSCLYHAHQEEQRCQQQEEAAEGHAQPAS